MGTHEGGPPMGMIEDVGDAQAEADRWNSKGNAYLAVRDYITAISCFDLALKTHPASEQEDIYLSNRATAHFRIGSYEAAVEGFRQASRLQPKKHSHFTCLGKVYLRWGRHENEALTALEESLRLEHTDIAANLAAKAHMAIEKAKQWRASGGPTPHPPPASAQPHPPHRSPEHLTKKIPTVQDFSKPTGPVVKLSSARARGLLRSDSGAGGVAMISFDESNAVGGGGGGGGGGAAAGTKGSRGGSRVGTSEVGGRRAARPSVEALGANGALRDFMKHRAHFDVDDDNDDDDGHDGDGKREAGTAITAAVAAAAAATGKSRSPRTRTTKQRTAAVTRASGSAPSAGRLHRKNLSGGSISSLIADESVGIVGAASKEAVGGASCRVAPAPGTGVVARAVARVEYGPADETVKAILAKARSKQIAEEAACARKKLTPAKARAHAGRRSPPPPYPAPGGYSAATTGGATGSNGDAAGEETGRGRKKQQGCAGGMDSKLGGADSGTGTTADQGRDTSSAGPSTSRSEEAQERASRTAQSPPPSPGGSELSALSDMLPASRGRRNGALAKHGDHALVRPLAAAAGVGPSSAVAPPAVVVVVRAGSGGRPETKPVRFPAAAREDSRGGGGGGVHRAPMSSSCSCSSSSSLSSTEADAVNAHDESESEDSGGGGNGFLSNVAALEAVARTVRKASSVNLAAAVAAAEKAAALAGGGEKPNAAAVAAIAAGAAPVKWGKEGAAERRALAVAGGSDSGTAYGDGPPDLGPLVTHGRRSSCSSSSRSSNLMSGSSNSRTGRSNGDGSGYGNNDKKGEDNNVVFTGRLDTGNKEDDNSKGREGMNGEERRLRVTAAPASSGGGTSEGGSGGSGGSGIPPPPSYHAAEEMARLGIAPRGLEGRAQIEGSSDQGSSGSWQTGDNGSGGGGGGGNRNGGSGEVRRHDRRASDERVRYRGEADEGERFSSGGVEGDADRASSLVSLQQQQEQQEVKQQTRRRKPQREVFLDNEEGEWGQAPTSRFRRMWWPGRSRHIPVGICLDSPNVARRAALESATNGEKPARFGWGFHARGGGGGGGGGNGDDGAAKIDSRRRVDTQVFLSTGSEPTMFYSTNGLRSQSSRPSSALEHSNGGSRPGMHNRASASAGEQLFAATADVGCFQRSQSSRAKIGGGGGGGGRSRGYGGLGGGGGLGRGGKKRVRRWVNGKKHGGRDPAPTEEAVEKWICLVLGPRALGLVRNADQDGDDSDKTGVSLAEELKDGRLLVRLAHTVGGARTAGMAEDLEASTPMLQLVNVHAFLAAARAIGVPTTSLFHAKDLVDGPASGRCSPAVLRCLAALSDAVRRSASTGPPGDVYHGPLLGDDQQSDRRTNLTPTPDCKEGTSKNVEGGPTDPVGGGGHGGSSGLSGKGSRNGGGGTGSSGGGGGGDDGVEEARHRQHEYGEEETYKSSDSSALSAGPVRGS